MQGWGKDWEGSGRETGYTGKAGGPGREVQQGRGQACVANGEDCEDW